MPDGSKIPATGKSVEMNGCQVAQFEDGKMIKATQYYIDDNDGSIRINARIILHTIV